MDARKRQDKFTENVALVGKVETLKPISCGRCGKPGHIITTCWMLGYKAPCEHCGKLKHKSEIVELPRISCKKELNQQG